MDFLTVATCVRMESLEVEGRPDGRMINVSLAEMTPETPPCPVTSSCGTADWSLCV